MAFFENVFSQYTVTDVALKVAGADAFVNVNGAGSASEEYEQKTVTKANSNVVVKKIVRSGGSGTLTLSLHMPYELYNTAHGMVKGETAGLIDGVYGLQSRAQIPSVEIAMQVEDEDGNKMFKYYPSARCSSFSESVTSEEDTVAEVEMQFELSADSYGLFRYTALAKDLPTTGDITADTWLTAVSSAKLQKAAG